MKVAAVNSWSVPLNLANNLDEISGNLHKLNNLGIEYALFPELSVSGYINSPELLMKYSPQHKSTIEFLKSLSTKLSIVFSVGLPMPTNGVWTIAQLSFRNGKIIGSHHKTHLSVHEKETFVSGIKLQLIELNEFKMGMQLCLESHFPELSLYYQKKGANLLNFAFASPRETTKEKLERFTMFLRARAYDNSCFVMACNSTGKTPSGKNYAGVALIISPRGKIIAHAKGCKPSFCVANINLNEISEIKNSVMSNFPAYRNTQLNMTFNA